MLAACPPHLPLLPDLASLDPPSQPKVSEGTECGLGVEGFLDWVEGDKLECYLMVAKNRRLEEAKASTAVDVASLA